MGEGGRGEPPGSPREQWGGRMEFLLSLLGYCVGLGNVWRFPYLCYRNGGGAFLIPYLLMLALCGLPVFLMELSLGQFSALGPLAVWRCCPILTGIGYAMLILSVLVSLYYVVIIAWTLFYLFSSFQSPLPWACEAPNNQHLCTNLTLNETHATPSEVFWNERVLQVGSTQGLHDPGRVRGELAGCLLLAWVIIWLCLFRGVRSSGKVVYVTATFPYAVLLILLVRGATLEGSLQGVAFYLTPQWERLAQPQVWNDAATQIFYSLGVGFGGLLSLASYNKHNNNVIRDTLIVALGNCATSLVAGFAIFAVLGHMAQRKGVSVGDVADSGPGLAFVVYPEALALLPFSSVWSILFFLMLLALGVDSLFGMVEAITATALDLVPWLRPWKRKAAFLAATCGVFYLLGLLLVTQGGVLWFTLLDSYAPSFGLLIVALCTVTGISGLYVSRFSRDVCSMMNEAPSCYSQLLLLRYFQLCWMLITPLLLTAAPAMPLPPSHQRHLYKRLG
ncbi:LOW QUALITY PROTEIN: sodium-dependent proline transporter-like [Petromyzon marinus]|uniref:LOW QUALITY PROTEIN: sodium-dependent proline transporter-like n=1 Tax=Petromyzon marinus TaxID=7757 RepID=UPI003F6E6F1A